MKPVARYRLPLICAAAILLFAVVLLYAQSNRRDFKKDDGFAYVIGVSQFSTETVMENAFKQNIIDSAAGHDGLNVLFSNAGTVAEKQSVQIETLLQQNVDAIIIDAPDFSKLENTLQKARELNIPVVLVGDENTVADCDALVIVDYFAIGRKAGEYLLSLDPPPASILEVQGAPKSGKSVLLQNGLREALRESGSRIPHVIAGYDSAITAEQRARDSQMNNPEFAIDGVFIHSAEMVPGIVKVLPETPLVTVGVEGQMNPFPQSGAMVLAFSGGREAVELALGLIESEPDRRQTLVLSAGETVPFEEGGV